MLFHVLALVVFSTSPTFISSLQCIQCKENIVVNYTVTSETIPSFAHCQHTDTQVLQCFIRITWDQINNITTLWIDGLSRSSTKTSVGDSDNFDAAVQIKVSPDQKTPSLEHYLDFSCSSHDKCNNETNLKKIFRSLIIKDQFIQEIIPILEIVSPFDPKSAQCFDFDNDTIYCAKSNLSNCQHCSSTVTRSVPFGLEVCQTCPDDELLANSAMRFVNFQLSTRKNFYDTVSCKCQLKKCNSIDNSNRIYKASQITFDFEKFYNNNSCR